MVRRVAFGDDEGEKPRRSRIGRNNRKFGIMPDMDADPNDGKGKPRFSRRFENPIILRDDSPAGKRRAKWIIVGFLSIWLAVWGFGLFQAIAMFGGSNGFGAAFLMVWIVGGGAAWFVVAFILFMLLFGKEKIKPNGP